MEHLNYQIQEMPLKRIPNGYLFTLETVPGGIFVRIRSDDSYLYRRDDPNYQDCVPMLLLSISTPGSSLKPGDIYYGIKDHTATIVDFDIFQGEDLIKSSYEI